MSTWEKKNSYSVNMFISEKAAIAYKNYFRICFTLEKPAIAFNCLLQRKLLYH